MSVPPLPRLILDAWNRLKPRIFNSPSDLARRLARRHGKTFSRPPRAWCLAVRACDHRIGARNGHINPDYATDPHDPDHPGRVIEHTITLTPGLLRELCCPVQLEPPGEAWDEAARKLGRLPRGLNNPRINGTLHTRHIPRLMGRPGRPVPMVFCRRPLDPANARNFDTPHPLWISNEYVSARVPNDLHQTILRVPLYVPTTRKHPFDDPAHPEIAEPPERGPTRRLPSPAPDYVWYKWSIDGRFLGNDSRYWRKSPSDPGFPPPPGEDGRQKRRRNPKPRPPRPSGSLVFRGWRWKCPRCHKLVRTLYMPAPPLLVLGECVRSNSKSECRNPKESRNQKDRNSKLSLEHSNLEHSNFPRISEFDIRISPRPRPPLTTNNSQLTTTSFGCAKCHRIRGFSAIAANSWNDLVSYFSCGLLYGHEVPIPDGYRESATRKNRYTPQLNRPSPRRQQLLTLLLDGLSPRAIAERMHLRLGDIQSRISLLLKAENVPDRPALATKYGKDPATQPGRLAETRRRRAQVLELLRQGLTAGEIARKLGVKPKIVWNDTYTTSTESMA